MHLVHHAVKHRGDALIGYMIYLCFTNGVKPSPPWGPPWGPPQVFTQHAQRERGKVIGRAGVRHIHVSVVEKNN